MGGRRSRGRGRGRGGRKESREGGGEGPARPAIWLKMVGCIGPMPIWIPLKITVCAGRLTPAARVAAIHGEAQTCE